MRWLLSSERVYLLFAVSDHYGFFTQYNENGLSVKVKKPVWYFVIRLGFRNFKTNLITL